MSILFEKTEINGMPLKNRLVRSATWEGMCDNEGRPGARLAGLYRELGKGGVGLIITGYAFVRPDGKQMPGAMGIHTDDFSKDMGEIVSTVHQENSLICMQLVHAGGQTTSAAAGGPPVAPSSVKVDQFPEEPMEIALKDLHDIIAAFGSGARRAKEYGFDAVQLHAAHGYLISQFLSPHTNRRQDSYGGSLERRSRFLFEVYETVRSEVGRDYPVLVKINGEDFLEGGLTADEAATVCARLSEIGIDAIEVSGGTPASAKQTPVRVKIEKEEQEAYHGDLAAYIKGKVTCPVMVVGGIRSFNVAEAIIAHGKADYISLSRPFIREPNLALRWQSGDRDRARCISCNGCFKPGIKEGGIYCVVDNIEKEGERRSL